MTAKIMSRQIRQQRLRHVTDIKKHFWADETNIFPYSVDLAQLILLLLIGSETNETLPLGLWFVDCTCTIISFPVINFVFLLIYVS
jgi:hypothetical protein